MDARHKWKAQQMGSWLGGSGRGAKPGALGPSVWFFLLFLRHFGGENR